MAPVPKQPELVISAPISLLIDPCSVLVIEPILVKLLTLLSAPDVSDPGSVIDVDNKLAIGVPANERPEVGGTENEMPVAALIADTVCSPLCV
mgnify:FL=1